MYAVVMISVVMVLLMKWCTQLKARMPAPLLNWHWQVTACVCRSYMQSLADATSIGDFVNSSVCMEPCYSLVYNVANNCEEFVSYI